MGYEHFNGKQRRIVQKAIASENKKFGSDFVEMPFNKIEHPNRIKVFRSNRFLVQVFQETGGVRLSINRTEIDRKGAWLDGISWDDLYAIKNAIGYADRTAIEIYPKEKDLVNAANMRHLWILTEELPIGWRNP